MKKKYFLSLGVISSLGAAIGLSSCGWPTTVSGAFIDGTGSNSVVPLVKAAGDKTIWSIDYTGVGSAKGFASQVGAKPQRSFGMMSATFIPGVTKTSDDESSTSLQTDLSNWNKNHIRTITWAKDSIGIGLNLPSGVTTTSNQPPEINISELYKLYDKDPSDNPTWGKLLRNESSTDSAQAKNSKVTPMGRLGGESTSGKAEAFFKKLAKYKGSNPNDLDVDHNSLPSASTTPDNSVQAITATTSTPGALNYFSLGVLLKNQSAKLKTASIYDDVLSNKEWATPTIANAKNGSYEWIRPFNISYSVDNVRAVEFVNTLLSPLFQGVIDENGYISLTLDEIQLEAITHKLTDDDQKSNGSSDPKDKTTLYYGLKVG